MAEVILSEVQPTKVEKFKPSEQVKKAQHTNCPVTERAVSIIKDLYRAIGGLQPPCDCLPDSGQVVEEQLQEDEIIEQDPLEYEHPPMEHNRQDGKDLAGCTGK
jgi:hypothetical protein